MKTSEWQCTCHEWVRLLHSPPIINQRLRSTIMNSNQSKANFLGMPWGTANARLRKSILFDLVRQLGQDECYKCHKQIQVIEEFSIEHKQPWENISVELFWDISNIAFSHLRCNIGTFNRIKTSCINGHLLTGNNVIPETRISPKGVLWKVRQCRVCKNKGIQNWKKKTGYKYHHPASSIVS